MNFNLEYFLALSIHINVVSGNTDKKWKEWTDKNFSGRYHLVETVNGRPVFKVSLLLTRNTFNIRVVNFLFQRDEKIEKAYEIYLWYHGTEKDWRLTIADSFKARNNHTLMKFNSQGKEEL